MLLQGARQIGKTWAVERFGSWQYKYFCEDAPQYHVIAAGSLLGVAVKRKHMKVPVGQVNKVDMYPVTFREFLRMADPFTFDYVESISAPGHLPAVIFNKLASEYRRYQICGGMPEAASLMLDGAGMAEVDAADRPGQTLLLDFRWPR